MKVKVEGLMFFVLAILLMQVADIAQSYTPDSRDTVAIATFSVLTFLCGCFVQMGEGDNDAQD